MKSLFGVSSLTCACGYEPLLDLQSQLGESAVRLKYFMDPQVRGSDEPDDITLFHSKLVYLYLPTQNGGTSVVYLGSHNWSSRALGPGRPRNAEASVRFQLDYSPEHLAGEGDSIASEVNRHLRAAYSAGDRACPQRVSIGMSSNSGINGAVSVHPFRH